MNKNEKNTGDLQRVIETLTNDNAYLRKENALLLKQIELLSGRNRIQEQRIDNLYLNKDILNLYNDNEDSINADFTQRNDKRNLNNDTVNTGNDKRNINNANVNSKNDIRNISNDNRSLSNDNRSVSNDNRSVSNDNRNQNYENVTQGNDNEIKQEWEKNNIRNNLDNIFGKKYIKKVRDRFTEELHYLMNNQKVFMNELLDHAGTSVPVLMRDVRLFKSKGWMVFVGGTRIGYYQITKEGRKLGD